MASIIDIQDSDINEIHDTMESTSQITSKATEQLEIASGRKFTFKPLIIGAAALSIISLPISLSAGAQLPQLFDMWPVVALFLVDILVKKWLNIDA